MPGAYGFELLGVGGAAAHLVRAEREWPRLEIVRHTRAPAAVRRSVIGTERAEIALAAGDRMVVERDPLRAAFTTARPLSDEALVHPYLAPAAAIAGYWLGREAFHGGAVLLNGGAWVILGDKGSGKSSLLAGLARQGHSIYADDAVMLEGDTVFAGPRSIDLRREAALELGAGERIGVVGDRERWRLRLGQVPSTSSLRGWVFIAWGDSLELTGVSPGGRVQQLLEHRMIKGLPPPKPKLILELSALPAFRLSRPRLWPQLETAASALVDTLSGW